MFSPELSSGAVQPVLADWFLPPFDLWTVYPTGRMPSAKARAFAAFVEAELKAAEFVCRAAAGVVIDETKVLVAAQERPNRGTASSAR